MVFSILKNKNYRRYFFADIIASFGNGLVFIGMNWFILQSTGSNTAVGNLLTIILLSSLLVYPIAGSIVDKFPRKNVIIVIGIIRAVTLAGMAAIYFSGHFAPWMLYFLGIVTGVGWAVFMPASRGFVQEILDDEELLKGNSLLEVSLQAGMFTAAAMGGVLFQYFGFGTIFVVNAVLNLASIFMILPIRYTPHVSHDSEDGFVTQFVNGWKYLLSNRNIFFFGIVMFLPFVVTMVANVVLPGYVMKFLHGNAIIYGTVDMSYGIGACISGLIAVWVAHKLNEWRAVIFFFILSILCNAYLVVNTTFVGLYVSALFFGVANSSLRIILNTVIMRIVPKSFMGRSMSVWLSISLLIQVFLASFLGRFIDIVPIAQGYTVLAGIMLVGLVGAIVTMRRLSLRCPTPVTCVTARSLRRSSPVSEAASTGLLRR